MRIGLKLKDAREARGMSMSELAKRSGVNISTISQTESGNIKKPKADTLRKLAAVLDVSLEYFFEEDTEVPLVPAPGLVRVPREIIELIMVPEAEPYLLAACKAFKKRVPLKTFMALVDALEGTQEDGTASP